MIDGEKFRETMLSYFKEFTRVLATDQGDWVVKGFIDVFRNIYTISVDTKVVSKVIELMLFPVISRFAIENNYKLILSEHQNHYSVPSEVLLISLMVMAISLRMGKKFLMIIG